MMSTWVRHTKDFSENFNIVIGEINVDNLGTGHSVLLHYSHNFNCFPLFFEVTFGLITRGKSINVSHYSICMMEVCVTVALNVLDLLKTL